MKKYRLLTVLTVYVLFASVSMARTTVRYVKENGSGDGSSWSEASGNLQAVINLAVAGDEIWVAKGKYYPAHSADGWTEIKPAGVNADANDRNNAFVLKPGLRIYGGFAGHEQSPQERATRIVNGMSLMSNETILSGNIGNPDDPTDNCYHVVIGAGMTISGTEATRLDGFTVTGGHADGDYLIMVNDKRVYNDNGGGIYAGANSSLIFTNLMITGNVTSLGGDRGKGGGIYSDGKSAVRVINTIITANVANSGGGIYCDDRSAILMTNAIISSNSVRFWGGGIYNGGAPVVTNVLICGNTAEESGGGIYNEITCTPILTNITVAGNYAGHKHGGITFCPYSVCALQVRNSIIYGNFAGTSENNVSETAVHIYAHTIVEGVAPNGGIISCNDPLFISALKPSAMPTSGGDYRLKAGSPAIDSGNKDFFTPKIYHNPNDVDTDITGNLRVQGNNVDLGAFEFYRTNHYK
jgi:predicted outer membrane repeat protein